MMMACAVECYPAVLPTCTFMQEAPLLMDTTPWLQMHNSSNQTYPLGFPATTYFPQKSSISSFACGGVETSHNKPQNKPSSCSSSPAWWESDIAVEVHRTLKGRETKLGELLLRSPQLHRRRELVNYLALVCRQTNISVGSRFLAVRLMDYFMDGHAVMDYRLKLVALTCLLVAAKFEEPDDHLPTIDTLQQAAQLGTPDYYTREEFQTMEIYLLRVLKWSVSHPTSAHFADFYLHLSINEIYPSQSFSDHWDKKLLELHMKQTCDFFIESSLRDDRFLKHKPSEIAAATVCAARVCCQFPNAWGPKLQELSSYSLEDLSPLVSNLLRLQKETVK